MPMSYTMPTIPNRYPLDNNDKLGLLLGSLLSAGMGYAGNKNSGADPWANALAGGVAGFGMGGKAINDNYSAMLDDYLKQQNMDIRNKQLGQENQIIQSELPLRQAQTEEARARAQALLIPKLSPLKQKVQDYEGMDETQRAIVDKLNTRRANNITADDYMKAISTIDTKIAKLQNTPAINNESINNAIDSLNLRKNALQSQLDIMQGKPTYADPIIKQGIQQMFQPSGNINSDTGNNPPNTKEWYKWR